MGCGGSKYSKNVVVPFPEADVPAVDAKPIHKVLPEPTEEERSAKSTPPQTPHEAEPVNDNAVPARLQAEAQNLPSPVIPPPSPPTAVNVNTDADAPKEQEMCLTPPIQRPKVTDVDAIQLPTNDPGVPYWERTETLPARPGTSSRRPGSSAGKLVVYKTAAQKKAEAEAKRRRGESGEDTNVKAVRASALPPMEERKKLRSSRKTRPQGTHLEEDVAIVDGTETKADGGQAWAIDDSEFVGAGSAPPAKSSNNVDMFSLDDD